MKKELAEKFRDLVGNGELNEALEQLDEQLAAQNSPLRDDAILLKGRLNKFEREQNLGIVQQANEENLISKAMLDLIRRAEKEANSAQNQPVSTHFQPNTPAENQPQPAQNWLGRLWIDGDQTEYYLHPQGAIFGVNFFTRAQMQVAQRHPSANPAFAWTYFVFAFNAWASVDHQGLIWAINAWGQVVRIGQFQAF